MRNKLLLAADSGVAFRRGLVDAGAALHQQSCAWHMAIQTCQIQRIRAILVGTVDVGAALRQQPRARLMPTLTGDGQWRSPISVSFPQVGAVHHQPYACLVASMSRCVKPSLPV